MELTFEDYLIAETEHDGEILKNCKKAKGKKKHPARDKFYRTLKKKNKATRK